MIVDDDGVYAHHAYCVSARDVRRLPDGSVRALFVGKDGTGIVADLPGPVWGVIEIR